MTRAEELEAIRARHEADSEFKTVTVGWLDEWEYRQVRVRELNAEELHTDRAFLLAEVERLMAENGRLKSLIRAMIENEPDDIVADGGHTVLDEWRYNARALLEPAQ